MNVIDNGFPCIVHLCFGGHERWISCAGKVFLFEDHHYCGPVVLNKSTRDPSENQPSEKSIFWQHVQAWYEQGKQTKEIDGKVWCVYEAQILQRMAGLFAAKHARGPVEISFAREIEKWLAKKLK